MRYDGSAKHDSLELPADCPPTGINGNSVRPLILASWRDDPMWTAAGMDVRVAVPVSSPVANDALGEELRLRIEANRIAAIKRKEVRVGAAEDKQCLKTIGGCSLCPLTSHLHPMTLRPLTGSRRANRQP